MATLSTFPQVPLTRECTCTQAIDPGTSGSTLTPANTSRQSRSSGHFPDFPWPGSPWLAHGSPLYGDWSPNPTGLLVGAFGLPPHPMFPFATYRHRPNLSVPWFRYPLGLLCSLIPPSSRVYTPQGHQQPCGAGPLDPHTFGACFVCLALVAPLPPPPLSPVPRPVTHPGLFPASRAFPVSWGRRVAPATCPSLSRPLFPASGVYTPLGRQLPFDTGPLVPHPSWDRFVCLALVAPFPPPSAWVVRFLQDLWSVLLPGPRAPRYPCLFPTSSPAVVVFVLFSRATYGLSSARLLRPIPPQPVRSVLHALRWRCGVLFLFVFFFCPPLPRLASCLVVPSCLHACTSTLHRPSVTAPLGALLLSLRLPGPWPLAVPNHARWAPLPLISLTSPFSTLSCLLSPARPLTVVLLLGVLSAGPLRAMAVSRAPSRASGPFFHVLRTVGRLGRTPQIPLRGDSPVVRPHRPPLHQFPYGWAGRPVQLNAGPRHGVSLC